MLRRLWRSEIWLACLLVAAVATMVYGAVDVRGQLRSTSGSAADVTFVSGGSPRTVTLSGNPTIADWFDQSVKAGASPAFAGLTVAGSAVSAPLTGVTASLGGGALLAGACASGTVTVSGATTSMSATATPLGAVDPKNGNILSVAISAQVTSANTVTVRICSPIAGTPAATTYKVVVQ